MSKEAMKLALEALCKMIPCDDVCDCSGQRAITTLREALAEQPTDWEAVAADQAMTIALLRAEQPAQQQEPVAYWIPKAEQFCIAGPSGRPFAKAWEPLYTSPPAQRTWVGLTQDEFRDFASTLDYGTGGLIRAIEAKLKEKNT